MQMWNVNCLHENILLSVFIITALILLTYNAIILTRLQGRETLRPISCPNVKWRWAGEPEKVSPVDSALLQSGQTAFNNESTEISCYKWSPSHIKTTVILFHTRANSPCTFSKCLCVSEARQRLSKWAVCSQGQEISLSRDCRWLTRADAMSWPKWQASVKPGPC